MFRLAWNLRPGVSYGVQDPEFGKQNRCSIFLFLLRDRARPEYKEALWVTYLYLFSFWDIDMIPNLCASLFSYFLLLLLFSVKGGKIKT